MRVGIYSSKLLMVLKTMMMVQFIFKNLLSRHTVVGFTTKPSFITKPVGSHYLDRFVSSRCYFTKKEAIVDAPRDQIQLLQDMLYRIQQVNSVPVDIRESLLEFRVAGMALGRVRPNIAKLLCSFNICTEATSKQIDTRCPAFKIEWDDDSKPFLTLTSLCGDTFESRSEAIATVTKQMKDLGIITGWRDELFPVTSTYYSEPMFAMERAAVSFLGVPEYGVHIIGLVQSATATYGDADNRVKMWMARRSATKSKFPGMMDHIAAGGQPIGLSLIENVVKECFEEAGIPETITRKGLRPVGAVSYENYVPKKDVVVCVSESSARSHYLPWYYYNNAL
jgi:hypothetical protein